MDSPRRSLRSGRTVTNTSSRRGAGTRNRPRAAAAAAAQAFIDTAMHEGNPDITTINSASSPAAVAAITAAVRLDRGGTTLSPVGQQHNSDSDSDSDSARDVQELCLLQQQLIHHTTAAGPPRLPALCETLADVTPRLLYISSRIIERTQRPSSAHHQQPSPTTSAASSDHLAAGDDDEGIDIITVLLLIAAYGRLYDLFHHVCQVLRRHLSRYYASGNAPRTPAPDDLGGGRGGGGGGPQFVVVAEFMMPLLMRLERGQEHLMAAVNIELMAQSSSSDGSSRSPSPSPSDVSMEMEGVEGTGPRPAVAKAGGAGADSSAPSLVHGAMLLLEALEARHDSLCAQVATVKRIAEGLGDT